MLEMDPEKRPTSKEVLNEVSINFQTFQLKNQQTTADQSSAMAAKSMSELSITEKVNAIIIFDVSDKHMYLFNLSTKEWRRMQEFPDYDSDYSFTTVVSGKHIYFIQNQKVYQLEYSDSAAEWKEMLSTIKKHGEDPPAAVLNGFIYVCGTGDFGSDGADAERYDAALDRWDRMRDMNTARCHPCVVATEDHIYCIGGWEDRDGQWKPLQSFERFDEMLNKWEFVESAPRSISLASADVVKNRIYVKGTKYEGILCYDIQNDSWSETNLTIKWPFMIYYYENILAVDEELYIIGIIGESREKFKYAIYLLEPETKQMTLVEKFEDKQINIQACRAVKL